MRTPSSESESRVRSTEIVSSKSVASLSSTQRLEGLIPFARMEPSRWERSWGSASCRPERLTATETGVASGLQLLPDRGLPASLLDHPAADRHDQASLLGDRDEGERADQATVGMVPAQHRLHRDDGAVAQPDHRLVVKLQFLALDRTLQVVLDLHVLDHPRAHDLIEDLVAAAAVLLGAVEGGVGVPDQTLGFLAAGADRDSDAGADEVLPAAQDEGPGERLGDALGDPRGAVLAADVLGEDGEFVPAEAGHGVRGAQGLLDPGGDRGQQLITGGMSETVVDQLELVEVQEEH